MHIAPPVACTPLAALIGAHPLVQPAGYWQVGVLPARREAFRQILRASGPQVLALLIHVCDQCRAQPELMQQMLKCTSSWMRHVPLPSAELARSSILSFSFQVCSGTQVRQ